MKTTPETIIALIRENSSNPKIRGIALGILKSNGLSGQDRSGAIKAVADWVHNTVKFKNDPEGMDVMFPPLEALRLGAQSGVDCEDFTTLTASLLGSLGIPVKIKIVSKTGEVWDHVYLQANPGNGSRDWMPVDTTISPSSGVEIPYVREKVLAVKGTTALGSPGDVYLIDLLEQIISPAIAEEVNQELNPYEISKLQGWANKLGATTERPTVPYKSYGIPGETINAFAIPGGNTYIYQGLLDGFGSDVVCGVLGHEIAHVARRHAINMYVAQYGLDFISGLIGQTDTQRTAKQILELVRRGYSREMEYEADKYSIHYNQAAGLYPFGIKRFLEWVVTVQKEPETPLAHLITEYTLTHPYASDRLERVNNEIVQLGITEKPSASDIGKILLPVGIGLVTLTGIIILRRK